MNIKELIKDLTELGFKPITRYVSKVIHLNESDIKISDAYNHMFLCEVQKLLRDSYNINITINYIDSDVEFIYYWFMISRDKSIDILDWQEQFDSILETCGQQNVGNWVDSVKFKTELFEKNFAFVTYEEALLAGIKEGIKLIK